MIDHINAGLFSEIHPKPPQKRPSGTRDTDDANTDATIDVRYASLINKAVDSDVPDSQAVEKAKELLLSGQLTTAKNVAEAAGQIVDFGV